MNSEESAYLDALVAGCSVEGCGLEIGTAAGGSLCRMIHAAKGRKFIAVDPMTYFPNQMETVRRNLTRKGVESRLAELRVDTSERARRASQRGREDFAFILIDGKHDALHVMRDMLWTHQLKVGGLVCLHDYTAARPGPYQAINTFIRSNNNAYQRIGQVGSLLALKKTATQPAHAFPAFAWLHPWSAHIAAETTKGLRRARRWTRKARRLFGGRRESKPASYEDHVVRRLARGKEHQTLGANPISDGHGDFEALLALGLRPHHRVLDFGCGSLRLGRWLIGYLTLGGYWGLDPSEKLIRIGLDRWYRDSVLPTNARLGVITAQLLDMAAKAQPDLILVFGVLQSVGPQQLELTMSQIAQCCGPKCRVVMTLLEAQTYTQLGRYAHRHALANVAQAATSAGLALEVLQRGREAELLPTRDDDATANASRATSIMMWPKNAPAQTPEWNFDAALACVKNSRRDLQARTERQV